jgi:hypothetical protein
MIASIASFTGAGRGEKTLPALGGVEGLLAKINARRERLWRTTSSRSAAIPSGDQRR